MRGDTRLNGRHLRALRTLANSSSDFEPLAARPGVGQALAEQLIALGLVESGPCKPRYADYGTGYRLTKAGWEALDENGPFKRRQGSA